MEPGDGGYPVLLEEEALASFFLRLRALSYFLAHVTHFPGLFMIICVGVCA